MKINDLESRPPINLDDRQSLNIKVPELELPHYRKLGRTDLKVSCLGLGGGGGISSADTLYAFDRGINYFFYSSDLHHYLYSSMAGALKKLCQRGSAVRDRVVLATVTYIKSPEVALAALLDQFLELGIDYIDVLFWGWIGTNDAAAFADCLNLSNDLRGPGTVYQRTIEKMIGVSDRLKKMGAVRYIGASFHDLDLAHQWLDSSLLDVVMVRHNVAHRSAQSQVFNCLDAQNFDRPGISTFKSAGSHSGALWDIPEGLPAGCWIPSVPDLYRYSLSQNCVDVCLTGMRSPAEIDAATLGIAQGKLTQAEIDYLGIYGDLHRKRLQIQDIPTEKLIYRS
ncbi:aldo/keto reductase [Chamaesiphon polymorphus]|uniref:Aldo/keto reductase n=1 Tax=Chamaesiphon polymorphus CCALA 037 TaxID=2107692 RepID=A0A2T1GKV4_9CYAN|nr:aldo/keto reductase [Chamaesiphon polymorphus]PSB58472.1 aldo/keto reductase [Chamaesiphon polymorphus CCALA 037]